MELIKIKSIKKREEKIKVYDITVEHNHNFFANRILCHNCHNYGTKKLLKYVKYPFKHKIALTATVERMDKAHWQIIEAFEYNVFKYSPKKALDDGILNPFYFTNIGIDMDEDSMDKYNKLTGDINMIMLSGGGFSKIMRTSDPLKYKMLALMTERKELVNNYPIKFFVIQEICEKHKDDKILVFNQFNTQTNKCYWFLLDKGLKTRILHSSMSKEKRDTALRDYMFDRANILLTTKVLDEGFNLPKIDVGIIAAGDSSPKQTIQRMGRILRKKDKHSYLYQIFCKQTIEEKYSEQRAKLFKELSTDYNEYTYKEREQNDTGFGDSETTAS